MESDQDVTQEQKEEFQKKVNEIYVEFNDRLADTVRDYGPDMAARCCVGGLASLYSAGYPKEKILELIDALMDRLEKTPEGR